MLVHVLVGLGRFSQMKAQEAAHRRKVTAAKKAYEEKVRKAEEDARIRAIMQGGLPPAP